MLPLVHEFLCFDLGLLTDARSLRRPRTQRRAYRRGLGELERDWDRLELGKELERLVIGQVGGQARFIPLQLCLGFGHLSHISVKNVQFL